jgi:pyruvyl transferase EpsI
MNERMKTLKERSQTIRRTLKHFGRLPVSIPRNIWFAYCNRHLRTTKKILYALTPPPRWKDIGDHAQVVAIQAWMNRHYPGIPVIEMDKDRARYFLPALKWLVRPDDLILLHSGGNIGDRGMWSESIRRLIVQTFRQNRIVSLPQTIFFSDTPKGRKERENTRRIYDQHPDLTIIARDPRSGEIARELFTKARILRMPDFVLSLTPGITNVRNEPPRALLVLRSDNESFFTPDQKRAIKASIKYPVTLFDTLNALPVGGHERTAVLELCLDIFRGHDIIVTDRFHGLIFSVICRKPCVALRSIDHKLLSGKHWFNDVTFVRFTQDINEIPRLMEECLAVSNRETPDYNRLYFDALPALIGWE